jgi:hypothetical protein
VSFNLDAPAHELTYWENLPLSPTAKQRIQEFIAGIPDEFRLDPRNRLQAGSPYFKIEYVFLDSWGDRRPHRIDFHVRDDKAAFGVLFIAYMELY